MALSFLSSSSCASILPTASPMIERYRSKGFPCCEGNRIGGWRKYSLISSKAFWHSSFHVYGSFFLRSLKMGPQVEVSLAINWLMYCNRPKKTLISFSLLGGGISNMALILDGSTSIPLSLIRKPSNFLMVTLKVHFCWFNLSLYSLILLKNFLKFTMWLSLSSILRFHYHIIDIHLHLIIYHVTRL